jgi:NAD(P)-dependent dehydrogenase (short-subunit alcohol dehydrogenase family)
MTERSPLFDLTARVVVVTGSARGLGRTLALGLAAHGAHIVGCDINIDGANATAEAIRNAGGTATAAHVDVAHAASCDAVVRHAVATFGRVDVLVNDAAIDIVEPLATITDDAWQRVLDVDLSGVMHMSRAVVR